MPVPARGGGRARESASSEAEMNPRARRSPLEGDVREAWTLERGGACSREPLTGPLRWAVGGHRGVRRALRVRF
jgi:hypothetical protein